MLVPVEDIRNKDWSPDFGTVVHVKHEEELVTITFKNGDIKTLTKGNELEVQQGGRF